MRLIDADALGTDFCDGKGCNTCTGKNKICIYEVEYSMKDVFLWLEQQPTIDAVQVVRCKDCKHFRTFRTSSDGEEIRTCVGKGIVDLNYDDFCSKGERKDDE